MTHSSVSSTHRRRRKWEWVHLMPELEMCGMCRHAWSRDNHATPCKEWNQVESESDTRNLLNLDEIEFVPSLSPYLNVTRRRWSWRSIRRRLNGYLLHICCVAALMVIPARPHWCPRCCCSFNKMLKPIWTKCTFLVCVRRGKVARGVNYALRVPYFPTTIFGDNTRFILEAALCIV